MEFSEEDFLGLFNRLFERLQQAGLVSGSNTHLHAVYVAKGGQYVNTQVTYPQPLTKGGEKGPQHDPPMEGRACELPEVLATDEAMVLWRKAQKAGYVGDDYQPLISRTQAALLADAMARRLGIKEKWKVFEGLWGRKYMRSDYNLSLTQQQSLDFQDELRRVFDKWK